ncbi:MAG: Apolipoprotein N-acyltransferase [Candidatus Anoxychlamydiales bacterium]|nr:Apolipoprotein N-acyltransferase [Candidatus Anoxychlamydiales bacterium]
MNQKKSRVYLNFSFFILSFLIVAFSQPAWIGYLGILASSLGYFLFWFSIYRIKSTKLKVILSFVWFFFVQAIWLSWLTSTKYQGKLIFLAYASLLVWFAIEFSIVSYIFLKNKKLEFKKIFLVASIWTILEWSKLFIMCGFPFNQVGLALTNHHISMQLASIIGIFGLSFYVIFVNLTALKAVIDKSFKVGILWVILAFFPYLYGYFHEKIYEKKFELSNKLNVCLVQTAILPEEKVLTKDYFDHFVSPMYQWQRIINFINKKNVDDLDLIVLPEAALPFSANDHFYPFEKVQLLFSQKFGEEVLSKLPILKEPFARQYKDDWYVSNSYFAKALSNIYQSEIAIGFDDFDQKADKSYNAAFYFSPKLDTYKRYEKQVLVPMGEYIPFSFLAKMALQKYGIASSFTQGSESKIFSDNNYSFSICYEEIYPNIMRKAKNKGAKCFVNLTNDAYFPKSRLFRQHFDHAKIRAVENGIPLIRACNTGVSAVVDSFGRVVDAIYKEDEARALFVKAPLFSYKTIYSLFGDYLVIFFSFAVIVSYYIKRKIRV